MKNASKNRLTVIKEVERIGKNRAFLCKCLCGNEKIVKKKHLGRNVKSCGCLNNESRVEHCKKFLANKNRRFLPEESSARTIWRKRYKQLPYPTFIELCKQKCFYCGTKPFAKYNKFKKEGSNFAKRNGYFTYNGIDRIDSKKGYTIDNVVPCCKYCNSAKLDRSVNDFKKWIKKVYTNTIAKHK